MREYVICSGSLSDDGARLVSSRLAMSLRGVLEAKDLLLCFSGMEESSMQVPVLWISGTKRDCLQPPVVYRNCKPSFPEQLCSPCTVTRKFCVVVLMIGAQHYKRKDVLRDFVCLP